MAAVTVPPNFSTIFTGDRTQCQFGSENSWLSGFLIHFTFALTRVLNFFELFICFIPVCLSWALIRCHCTLFLGWHRRSVWGWLGAISPEASPSPSPQNLLSWGGKNKNKYQSSQFYGFFTPLHVLLCFVHGSVLQLSRAEFISLFDGPPFVAF